VVIDFVVNHTSTMHPWFLEAHNSQESPKRNYYLWSDTGLAYLDAPNMFPDIKPSNWIYDAPTDAYYFATFYPEQADLNWDHPAVFDEMCAIMEYWAALGVDGFRIDAAPYLVKRDGTSCKGLPETHALLKRIRKRLEAQYPDVILIAEAHHDLATTKEYFGEGDECHMAYHFNLMEQIWLSLRDKDPERVRRIVRDSLDIPANCQWAIFLRSHDEISFGTVPEADRASLLAFLDPSHEYVWEKSGRTAKRISSIFNDQKEIEELYSMFYALPGAPVTYYGDEIGMQNLPTRTDVRDPRIYVRGAFDWERAKMQMADPASLFHAISNMLTRTNAEIVHAEAPHETPS
jgi:maltose alpha-D-glucosyltransferase/alpha-amylase